MDDDDSWSAAAGLPDVVSRREVRVGDRLFEVDMRSSDDGRVDIAVVSRSAGGAVRSEVRAVMAGEDIGAFVRVLGAELRSLAAWYRVPRVPYAQHVEQARQVHANAYNPWNAVEEQRLVARFREGAGIPDLSAEFGRSAGAIRGRLEQVGEIAAVRGSYEPGVADGK